jgi:hypothetical protein
LIVDLSLNLPGCDRFVPDSYVLSCQPIGFATRTRAVRIRAVIEPFGKIPTVRFHPTAAKRTATPRLVLTQAPMCVGYV